MPDTATKAENREDLVEAFQKHIGAPTKLSLVAESDAELISLAVSGILNAHAMYTKSLSNKLKEAFRKMRSNDFTLGDERLMRAQLMLEELSEALQALAARNEVELLDALADLSYVVSGTATTYDLPLDAAFKEVHRSNMTKGVVKHAEGIKGKGEGYSAPDLHSILIDYRLRN